MWVWASLPAAHTDIFQFIQKSVFDQNTCTVNWVPLTGGFDIHLVNCPIWGWNNSDKSIHSSLLSWRDRYLKKLKDKSQNSQSRRSSENHITDMKHIKYSDSSWTSYLCQSIWYVKGYNVHISSFWSCTSTLEMCIAVL